MQSIIETFNVRASVIKLDEGYTLDIMSQDTNNLLFSTKNLEKKSLELHEVVSIFSCLNITPCDDFWKSLTVYNTSGIFKSSIANESLFYKKGKALLSCSRLELTISEINKNDRLSTQEILYWDSVIDKILEEKDWLKEKKKKLMLKLEEDKKNNRVNIEEQVKNYDSKILSKDKEINKIITKMNPGEQDDIIVIRDSYAPVFTWSKKLASEETLDLIMRGIGFSSTAPFRFSSMKYCVAKIKESTN
ncbi:hypothetical protein [Halobacteriovorax sp. CON-3]|uniref:hypothetical protein n=1 Tax=Halobacteriovorax sp. CON-3 TaxID=3157710 RepID=UPI00371B6523